MNHADANLIGAARSAVRPLELREGFSAGGVGAAIRTVQGNIYTGICVDLGCGLGFCAEVAAMAQMLTQGETRMDTVVAVTSDGIVPPCGRCRETMAQIDARNLDCTVIIAGDRRVPLRDLLPDHWLTEDEGSEARSADDVGRGHPQA
jgi:cytidine deaminase